MKLKIKRHVHDLEYRTVGIQDETKNKQGTPTFLAMERLLTKTLNNR